MPIDDFLDPAQESRRLKKAQQRAWVSGGSSGGDSTHPGSGVDSLQLGPDANASGDHSTAVGEWAFAGGVESTAVGVNTWATGEDSIALGSSATTEHDNSVALGKSAGTTAAWQVMLGTSFHTVVVPGTFSNPSARRLKRDIEPAPVLEAVFPVLVEYEYIDGDGSRQLGYIADDLVGSDAERFVTFDDDGRPLGINYLGLLVAQVAQLNARLAALEERG
jgi:autotransporter adhesin